MKNLFLTLIIAFTATQAFAENIVTGEPETAAFIDPATTRVPDGETLASLGNIDPYEWCNILGSKWCKAQGEALISYSKKVEDTREDHVKELFNTWKADNSEAYGELRTSIKALEDTHDANLESARVAKGAPTLQSIYK